ncbi:MAG: peptide MFS transporter [Planctomycetaceae bacterium]|nr:peptide MFS transporter [Planctomycetaceae bacterium]
MSTPGQTTSPTVFGHPAGLFTLFFAEMWERFSFYGMRALLVFYMIKEFMGYRDSEAYAVYGAYTALVYMTPFFGGMLADRLLGARRAVVVGGLLMAAGHLMMMVKTEFGFFVALALLICGNGFFKPNISSIVGSLYPEGSHRRDGGFTIFYMGINLGAAMAPLLCGYIGETYEWEYGFGLATIGMLIGVAVFVAPTLLTQILISSGALAAAAGLLFFRPDSLFAIAINVFVAIALLVAGVISVYALGRGGLPKEAGGPPDPERLRRRVLGPVTAEWAVYGGTFVAVFLFALLVSGFALVRTDRKPVALIPESTIAQLESFGPTGEVAAVLVQEASRPAGLVLVLSGLAAFAYLVFETVRLSKIPRERMYVVLILTFFSMLFWSFFEQAGSSVNNFTDRNVDRVSEARRITEAEVGQTVRFRVLPAPQHKDLRALPLLSQEQLGHKNGSHTMKRQIEEAIRHEEKVKDKLTPKEIDDLVGGLNGQDAFTITGLTYLRAAAGADDAPPGLATVEWLIVDDNVGMGIGGSEVPASVFQSVNPIYIIVFGLVFTTLWALLDKIGLDPNTPVKFSLGLIQLALGFAAFWYGAQVADGRGMVALSWLFLGYLLQTTGELCLSPVGLSMVTKLSPKRLVSTVMGSWFLATAFSQFLAAIIAQFTGVSDSGDGQSSGIPVPVETLDLYGSVFGKIAISAGISGLICLALAPLLCRWMHEGVVDDSGASDKAQGSDQRGDEHAFE